MARTPIFMSRGLYYLLSGTIGWGVTALSMAICEAANLPAEENGELWWGSTTPPVWGAGIPAANQTISYNSNTGKTEFRATPFSSPSSPSISSTSVLIFGAYIDPLGMYPMFKIYLDSSEPSGARVFSFTDNLVFAL
jgi:hypothetical protein